MIRDIFPHIYHNEYKPVVPDSNSIILAYMRKALSAARNCCGIIAIFTQ